MLNKYLQAAAGNAAEPLFVESVFSTYLYTGNGSTQTITNGIDLSTKGGLVWMKGRSGATDHALYDTTRGATKDLVSNSTAAETTQSTGLTAFNTTGFAIGTLAKINTNAATYGSWTFRKQPKFFDVVTYTGTGTTRTVAHNLGSVPGMIIVKRTDAAVGWITYHRSLGADKIVYLNTTDASATSTSAWGNTSPTSTEFTVGTNANNIASGTFVAYLFAHDAGGFGDDGTENVISCGSYVGTGVEGSPEVNIGWEPQWLLIKDVTTAQDWVVVDTMRGLPVGSDSAVLRPNLSNAEFGSRIAELTATGFKVGQNAPRNNNSGDTYIYIAIRRGPMKTPTSGTEVFQPLTNQPISGGLWDHNILTDFSFYHWQNGTQNWGVQDRLRGSPDLSFNSTSAESALIGGNSWDVMTGYKNPNPGAGAYTSWAFRRAPGFFDVVCYSGDGATNRSINHNLQTAPQLLILKSRSSAGGWPVYTEATSSAGFLLLNSTAAYQTGTYWGTSGGVAPTASQFTVNGSGNVSTYTYVAYLFATVAGVSKVGSYTGSGTTKQIDCGFSGGARFILIKRTDSTGDWYVWDSARGIVAGNDPYILLNSGATSVTGTDYIDPYNAGFEISSTAPAAINANGGSFIFLAIA